MELYDVIESIDIVEYISQYVELSEKNGQFWGLSPFKDERTPSFSVNPSKQQFYDFSSGIGGNLYTFVKEYFHGTARQTAEKIQSYAGFSSDGIQPTGKLGVTTICRRYKPKKAKHTNANGKPYPDDVMTRYEQREDKLQVWEREGISKESLKRFQVAYDNFSNRLVYPIRNLQGEIVNIGGRTLCEDFKERGLRKYTYFSSWENGIQLLYGLHENYKAIKEQKEIILFEGCKSVLLADTWGIRNTAALLTSHLSEAQMKLLVALGCSIVFALDKGVDIRSDKQIMRLKRYATVWYLLDTDGILQEKDAPVDRGKEGFDVLYRQKRRLR